MNRFMMKRAVADEVLQPQQLLTRIAQLEDQAQQLSAGIVRLEDQAQHLLAGITPMEDQMRQPLAGTVQEGQVQQPSAGTIQPENQVTDGGIPGGFAGIGIFAVVLLIAGFLVSRFRSKGSGKKVDAKGTSSAFTSGDRALIELLSEIVDIINSVEK